MYLKNWHIIFVLTEGRNVCSGTKGVTMLGLCTCCRDLWFADANTNHPFSAKGVSMLFGKFIDEILFFQFIYFVSHKSKGKDCIIRMKKYFS